MDGRICYQISGYYLERILIKSFLETLPGASLVPAASTISLSSISEYLSLILYDIRMKSS